MATLENSVLFRDLTPAQLRALQWVAKQQSFAAGQHIFQQGDHGDGLYVIKEGAVDISSGLDERDKVVLSRLGPGDFFGEMAMFDFKPRSAQAVAAVETTTYFIPRLEILNLVAQSPVLANTMLREVVSRLRDSSQKYLHEVLQAERLAVVGRFARSIVHDLKNPLSVISLSAELAARQEGLSPGTRKPLELIRRQVDRILDLVAQILEFTGASGPGEVHDVDYSALVTECAQTAKAEAELRSIIVECTAPAQATRVRGDARRLKRVFQNLAGNALDVLGAGGKIQILARLQDQQVVTEFRDDGPGIPAEVAGRLFQAFVSHGKVHGSGLGLSICKRIIEDHHGWIRAENQPAGGAVFAFGLPLANPPPRA